VCGIGRVRSAFPSDSWSNVYSEVNVFNVCVCVEASPAIDEDLLSWMYEECCPLVNVSTAADVPRTVVFVLMYVDPNDSRFFWAALIYGNKVRALHGIRALHGMYQNNCMLKAVFSKFCRSIY